MKSIIFVALSLVAVAVTAPADPAEPIKIIRSDFDQTPEGGYSFVVETENGIKQQEEGQLKEVKDEENKTHNVIVVRGSYEYPKEGGLETISYYADETGFHAEGPSIPKGPEARR